MLEVIFTKTPRALAKLTSSNNGLATACSAAIRARSGPEAVAEPIIAIPISLITVRTSAKSTLTIPGILITSAMPETALCNTSLAARNASKNGTSSPNTSISFSLGMIIRESTCCESSSNPSAATLVRLPSNENGLVTTATVKMPISLATCAITGAAPVPVPPPIPAVINSMSAPSIISAMRSRSSIAALRPISGLAPAPNPLVMSVPICSTVLALLFFNACISVLAQINSTPLTFFAIMCSTALPPQPPTPITLMTASCVSFSIISNILLSPYLPVRLNSLYY